MMGIESTAMIMPGEVESGNIASAHANPGTEIPSIDYSLEIPQYLQDSIFAEVTGIRDFTIEH